MVASADRVWDLVSDITRSEKIKAVAESAGPSR